MIDGGLKCQGTLNSFLKIVSKRSDIFNLDVCSIFFSWRHLWVQQIWYLLCCGVTTKTCIFWLFKPWKRCLLLSVFNPIQLNFGTTWVKLVVGVQSLLFQSTNSFFLNFGISPIHFIVTKKHEIGVIIGIFKPRSRPYLYKFVLFLLGILRRIFVVQFSWSS